MRSSRVDTVVRVRRLQERVARGAVLAARRDARDVEVRRALTIRIVDRLAAATPADGWALPAHRLSVDAGVRALVDAGREAVTAAERTDTALDEWAHADRLLDGVVRLEERRTAAEQLDADRRTLADLDDMAVTRWNRAEHPIDGGP